MYFKLKILYFLIILKLNKWFYRETIGKLQNKRFKYFLRVLLKSPYYKPFCSDNAELKDFPFTNKAVFMENFTQINTCNISLNDAMEVATRAEIDRDFSPMIGKSTVGLSTGTSGNKGLFLASEDERAKWVASILDRVIGFSLKKRKIAFYLRANSNLYQSVNSKLLKFHFFDILKQPTEHIERLNTLNPQVLVAQPSMLAILAEAQQKGFLHIRPDKIVSVAEVLTDEDKKYISKVFNQIVHQVYQCMEGFLASTCKNGTLHFNEDFLIIEKKYIDHERKRFHPVITDLLRTTQPVVRYELNDIITEKATCSCGSKMMAIEQIDGRSDDIFTFSNKSESTIILFPDALRKAIVLCDETIIDYSVIQTSENSISLYINGTQSSFLNAEEALNKLFSEHNIDSVKINKSEQNPHITGDKKRRIKNEYRKTN